MKVYLLLCSDGYFLGVFSTKDKAREAQKETLEESFVKEVEVE